jgi:hypothetical protein
VAIRVSQSSQTISWFNDRLAEHRLTFKPPFQRNPVWLDKHKAYLVDTALRGLPIPEIYIQKETDDEGKTVYAIVDGQQRLRALLGFPRAEVELMEMYSTGRGGEGWEDLSSDEKKRYWNYQLIVREIIDATDADLRDLFQRLNQNTIRLNAQEIRNARYKGEFIQVVSDLADEPFWAEKRIVSANEIRRMLDIEYMAELLIGMMHGPQNKKQTLDAMFQAYEDTFPDKQASLTRFELARARVERLVPELASSRWRGKSDFYSLFLSVDALNATGRLTAKGLGSARVALGEFGDQVTRQLAKDAKRGRVPKNVAKYSRAVEKAASDKDRRETRHGILTDLLRPFYTAR